MTDSFKYRGFTAFCDETREGCLWFIEKDDKSEFIDRNGMRTTLTSLWGCANMAQKEIDNIIERGL